MGEEEYIKIAKRVNVHNFYGFMDSYNLTHGELLGIINYGIHSDISKFQKIIYTNYYMINNVFYVLLILN